ncbi:methyltransferase domain-containing protein [Cesiribacter sp. SM1]|uniref:methyltransferase domain-containing protein n=1 Tax=Cesiribacter sp. SM1 TaxID=2861196 RepID=UPI001CD540F0|nr:methyltransferase domain-containing protein [Cesiribacter sp. SM1]
MSDFNEKYWTDRYLTGQTQWDAGNITTPLKEYFDKLQERDLKILIPGGGNGYEAEYLHKAGFSEVYLLDISPLPLQQFKIRNPHFPEAHLLLQDFFKLDDQFDLLVEQTFFCALHPSQRTAYAKKAHELLKPGGHLLGLLFDAPLNEDFPPFGGSREEYLEYFEPLFTIQKFEPSYNSIKPRAGRELWIDLVKP